MSEAPVSATPATTEQPATTTTKVEEAGFKVFAGNLAYTTTDEGLKTFFASHASNIISAQVILRGTRSAGYGFVAFKTLGAAEVAVAELNGKELEGRPVIVEVAKPADKKDAERKEKKSAARKAGRRGTKAVPGEVSELEANGTTTTTAPQAADAVHGTDEAAKPKKKKKKSTVKKAVDAVVGAVTGDSTAAPTTTTAEGEKRAPRVKKPRAPRPTREPGVDPVGEHSKSMLFVANLGFNFDDAALAALFTDAGIKVVSARIVRRRWGQPRKSKGYGFVDVGDELEQKKAIAQLEGKEVDGRAIAVKVAVDTPKADEEDAAAAAAANPEAVVVAT